MDAILSGVVACDLLSGLLAQYLETELGILPVLDLVLKMDQKRLGILKPPYTVKLLSKMPEPRARHSTALCDDSIFIVGGRKTVNKKDNLSSMLRYDIKNNECRQLPELPYRVSAMATVKIIGGLDKDNKALNKVIIYNMKTGNSHMLPPMLHKRYGCTAVVIENTIVALGGRDELLSVLKSVERFQF